MLFRSILDLAGSQDAVVSYLIAGTQGDFPRATVEYEETLQGEFGVLNAINATIRDTWDNSHYDGANVHQVICEDVSDADIESNNLCFRSDVVVSELGDTYVIESNGTCALFSVVLTMTAQSCTNDRIFNPFQVAPIIPTCKEGVEL